MPENEMKPCPFDIPDGFMSVEEMCSEFRNKGWAVAVHNDYRLSGEIKTFWLWTHPSGVWTKGEGASDQQALFAALSAWNARAPAQSAGGGEIDPEECGAWSATDSIAESQRADTEADRYLNALESLVLANEETMSLDADDDEDVAYPPIGITAGMIRKARAAIDKLRNSARAVLTDTAQEGWRPIEAGPHDGTPVLVGWQHARWESAKASYEGGLWGWLDANMGFNPFDDQPSHFMPLPAAPSNVGTGEGA